jgi:glycosyltransferase involved in cell wall biosynthesis
MTGDGRPVQLSVVMPAYNEEGSIETVILEHAAVLSQMSGYIPRWEIVCVDDGSTDGTPQLLRRLGERVPAVRVIRQENQGIAAALATGFRAAQGELIYATGSDGQWPAKNLELLFASCRDGADLVVGVRTNRHQVYGVARRVVSSAFNWLPPVLFGVAVQDAGSIKLGRRECFLFDLISRSPFAEAERIIRARRSSMKVDFVPITFLSRTQGKERGASLKNITSSIRDVVLCWRAYSWSRPLPDGRAPVSRFLRAGGPDTGERCAAPGKK